MEVIRKHIYEVKERYETMFGDKIPYMNEDGKLILKDNNEWEGAECVRHYWKLLLFIS